MVRNTVYSLLLAAFLTFLLTTIPLVYAFERHVNEFEEGYTFKDAVSLLKELLTKSEVRENSEVYRLLEELTEAVKNRDVEGFKEKVSKLRGYIASNPEGVEDFSLETMWDLLHVASWNTTSNLEIRVDPVKLLELLKLVSIGEGGELSPSEAADLLEEISDILSGSSKAGVAEKFREASELLRSRDYEAAQEVYEDAVESLGLNLEDLAREGVDVEALLDLLSKIPRDLTTYIAPKKVEVRGGHVKPGDVYIPKLIPPNIPVSSMAGLGLEAFRGVSLELILEVTIVTSIIAILILLFYSPRFRSVIIVGIEKFKNRTAYKRLEKRGREKVRDLRGLIIRVYKSAVKILSLRGETHWPYETHREYLSKFKNKPLYTPFKLLTVEYEKAAYSGREVTEEDYKVAIESLRKIVEGES